MIMPNGDRRLKCATVAGFVLAHRDGCKRASGIAERNAAGADPISGLVAALRTRRKFFGEEDGTIYCCDNVSEPPQQIWFVTNFSPR
jgi:hypothetical protein